MASTEVGAVHHCFINYKHWAFAEEREVRLTTILSGEAMPPHHSTDNGKAERDVRWEHGAPRIHLFEGLDRQLPIKRIIVGPGPHQPTRQAELQALLSKLQLDIPVALSNIPLKF